MLVTDSDFVVLHSYMIIHQLMFKQLLYLPITLSALLTTRIVILASLITKKDCLDSLIFPRTVLFRCISIHSVEYNSISEIIIVTTRTKSNAHLPDQ